MTREQSERVPGIHDKSLLICHRCEILHCKTVLGPVLEYRPVASVCDQLVRVLCHARVEVVLYHCHYGCGLTALCRILVDWTGIHFIVRTETVHIDSSVVVQFPCKFFCKYAVVLFRKITQGIAYCENLFLFCENVLASWCVVYIAVVWLRFRKDLRDSGEDVFMEIVHSVIWWCCHL